MKDYIAKEIIVRAGMSNVRPHLRAEIERYDRLGKIIFLVGALLIAAGMVSLFVL